jgi:hypothetical protein
MDDSGDGDVLVEDVELNENQFDGSEKVVPVDELYSNIGIRIPNPEFLEE